MLLPRINVHRHEQAECFDPDEGADQQDQANAALSQAGQQ
jgi:hypothetical protein